MSEPGATIDSGQIDLFVETIAGATLRDDRITMEYPFFALQKQPLKTPLIYVDGTASIRVSPGERGIATIWDKDVLIYLTSLINAKIERGASRGRSGDRRCCAQPHAGPGTPGVCPDRVKSGQGRASSTPTSDPCNTVL